MAAEGGLLTTADLAAHKSDFDQALSVEYHGVEMWECPPNGQGITALVAANILRELDVAAMERGSAQHYHTLIEAIRSVTTTLDLKRPDCPRCFGAALPPVLRRLAQCGKA